MVAFENRSAAYIWYVSTGSGEIGHKPKLQLGFVNNLFTPAQGVGNAPPNPRAFCRHSRAYGLSKP